MANNQLEALDLDGDGDLEVVNRYNRVYWNLTRHLEVGLVPGLGRTAELDIYGAANEPFALFVSSAPTVPANIAPFGTLFIEPAFALLAATGSLDGMGRGALSGAIPEQPRARRARTLVAGRPHRSGPIGHGPEDDDPRALSADDARHARPAEGAGRLSGGRPVSRGASRAAPRQHANPTRSRASTARSRPRAGRRRDRPDRSEARQHDDREAGKALLQYGRELLPAHAGHGVVRDHEVERFAGRQFERLDRARGRRHGVAVDLEDERRMTSRGKGSSSTSSTRIGGGGGGTGTGAAASVLRRGNVRTNVVPPPWALSTPIAPPWRRTARPDPASPKPVPRSPFVEKNGSKQRSRTSSVMPTPSSCTRISASPSRAAVANVSVPPFGIASSALKIRFKSASRSSAAFHDGRRAEERPDAHGGAEPLLLVFPLRFRDRDHVPHEIVDVDARRRLVGRARPEELAQPPHDARGVARGEVRQAQVLDDARRDGLRPLERQVSE